MINLNLKEQTESVLKTLTPREEKVIKMRFGVGDGSEHTLEEVGQSFAVTRERIRQIEAKALRKLRHPSRSRKLRAFLEGRTYVTTRKWKVTSESVTLSTCRLVDTVRLPLRAHSSTVRAAGS